MEGFLNGITARELVDHYNSIPKEQHLAKEKAYRRGYRDGCIQSTHTMMHLKAKGFLRVHEVANIMYKHAMYTLFPWMEMKTGEYIAPIPKIDSWQKIRDKVFMRDGRYCKWCGSTSDLQIDHIIPVSKGGTPDEENLQVLCRQCNMTKGTD